MARFTISYEQRNQFASYRWLNRLTCIQIIYDIRGLRQITRLLDTW